MGIQGRGGRRRERKAGKTDLSETQDLDGVRGRVSEKEGGAGRDERVDRVLFSSSTMSAVERTNVECERCGTLCAKTMRGSTLDHVMESER